MTKKAYTPPSKAAARTYKALLLTNFTVLPEWTIPGTRMKFDFVVPALNMMVEVQGQQHEVFNSFHFDGKDAFRAAKGRDQKKVAYCEENRLRLVTLTEKEVMQSPGPQELLGLIMARLNQPTESEEDTW